MKLGAASRQYLTGKFARIISLDKGGRRESTLPLCSADCTLTPRRAADPPIGWLEGGCGVGAGAHHPRACSLLPFARPTSRRVAGRSA